MLTAAGLAVLAAAFYAWGADLQQTEASRRPWREMLVHPRWWLGIGVNALGGLLQAIALRLGTLLVVQPLLTLSVLFCLPLAARRDRHPLERRELLGAVLLIGGLSALVGAVAPGDTLGGAIAWGPASLAVAGASAVCLLLSRSAPLLGVAAGMLCGLGATFLKVAVTEFNWTFLAFAASTACGFWLMQLAFKRGSVVASFPALIVFDPLTSAWLGVWLFHETCGPWGVVGSVLALLGLVALCTSERVVKWRACAT